MSDMREVGREVGRIDDTFYGKEDHGILTVTVSVNFEGSTQGFGCLAFKDKYEAEDFCADLCATFGVRRLEDLKGKHCVALRCFKTCNEPIEGLEASSGKKFVITTWRRKHYPESPDPLESRRQAVQRDIEFHERRVGEMKATLQRIDSEYRPVEMR